MTTNISKQIKWVEENVFSAGEAAKFLDISRPGLYQAVEYGRLERTKNGYFLLDDLIDFKENKQRMPNKSK